MTRAAQGQMPPGMWRAARARHAPTTADAGSLDAEEYLDRCGVTAYMKDCVTLLLENRPDEPLSFMGAVLCGKQGPFGRSASPRLSSWPTPGIFWHWPSLLGQLGPNLGGPFLTQATTSAR